MRTRRMRPMGHGRGAEYLCFFFVFFPCIVFNTLHMLQTVVPRTPAIIVWWAGHEKLHWRETMHIESCSQMNVIKCRWDENDLRRMLRTEGVLVHCIALGKLSAKKHRDDTLVAWTKRPVRSRIRPWSDMKPRTSVNSDDVEQVCVELCVSMHAGFVKHHLC